MADVGSLNNFLSDVADALRQKSKKTDKIEPKDFDTEILSLPIGDGNWKPQDDWWDIEKILSEDTEDYTGKMIVLLQDVEDVLTLPLSYGTIFNADLIKTSDGQSFSRGVAINHAWDKAKDKECSLGYKTRYVIFYFKTGNLNFGTYNFSGSSLRHSLYMICENAAVTSSNYSYQIPVLARIEAIKFVNCNFNNTTSFKINNNNLEKITFINCSAPNIVSMDNIYNNCTSLTEKNLKEAYNLFHRDEITDMNSAFYYCKFNSIDLIDTSNVTKFSNLFRECKKTISVKNLNMQLATSVSNMFTNCVSLKNIENISNVKISGINLSTSPILTHESLINILNALYDYSSESTHTLTLGTTNLNKLSEEEIAIATVKNWTLA